MRNNIITIREAAVNDALIIAKLIHASWHTAYKHQLPEELLNQISVSEREKHWKEDIARKSNEERIYVAILKGKIVGVTWIGDIKDKNIIDDAGEIYSLYVAPEHLGVGVGSQLMENALEYFKSKNWKEAYVWVLHTNEKAQEFYEKRGFVFNENSKSVNKNGFTLKELQYKKVLTRS